jgi:hypothetical protein
VVPSGVIWAKFYENAIIDLDFINRAYASDDTIIMSSDLNFFRYKIFLACCGKMHVCECVNWI